MTEKFTNAILGECTLTVKKGNPATYYILEFEKLKEFELLCVVTAFDSHVLSIHSELLSPYRNSIKMGHKNTKNPLWVLEGKLVCRSLESLEKYLENIDNDISDLRACQERLELADGITRKVEEELLTQQKNELKRIAKQFSVETKLNQLSDSKERLQKELEHIQYEIDSLHV